MRLSAQPECSRALMQASMMACVISSMRSELIPNSRARLPAARAAAISISGTIGSVSSICLSANEVIAKAFPDDSESEKESNSGLDPGRNSAEALERQQSEGVHRQQHRQPGRCDGECAGLSDVGHGLPLLSTGGPKSNATATRASFDSLGLSL